MSIYTLKVRKMNSHSHIQWKDFSWISFSLIKKNKKKTFNLLVNICSLINTSIGTWISILIKIWELFLLGPSICWFCISFCLTGVLILKDYAFCYGGNECGKESTNVEDMEAARYFGFGEEWHSVCLCLFFMRSRRVWHSFFWKHDLRLV